MINEGSGICILINSYLAGGLLQRVDFFVLVLLNFQHFCVQAQYSCQLMYQLLSQKHLLCHVLDRDQTVTNFIVWGKNFVLRQKLAGNICPGLHYFIL